jgi:hypothetical protein
MFNILPQAASDRALALSSVLKERNFNTFFFFKTLLNSLFIVVL